MASTTTESVAAAPTSSSAETTPLPSRSSIYGQAPSGLVRLQCPDNSHATRIMGEHALLTENRQHPEIVSLSLQCSDGSTQEYPALARATDTANVAHFALQDDRGFSGLKGTIHSTGHEEPGAGGGGGSSDESGSEDGQSQHASENGGWWQWFMSPWRGHKPRANTTLATLELPSGQRTADPHDEGKSFAFSCLHEAKVSGVFVGESDHALTALQVHCGPSVGQTTTVPVSRPTGQKDSTSHKSDRGDKDGVLELKTEPVAQDRTPANAASAVASTSTPALLQTVSRCNPLLAFRKRQQEEDQWLYDIIGAIIVIFALALVAYIVLKLRWWSWPFRSRSGASSPGRDGSDANKTGRGTGSP